MSASASDPVPSPDPDARRDPDADHGSDPSSRSSDAGSNLGSDPGAEDNELLARWVALAGPSAASYGRDLITRYREPHRRYHTTTHLAHMLGVIDVLDGEATAGPGRQRPEAGAAAVRFAAWFHDAVYDIGGRDDAGDSDGDGDGNGDSSGPTNEERSAQLAGEVLRAMGLPEPLTAEVARLVRCTADHRFDPDDHNAALLCDADLAILGSEPRLYLRYAEQIRDEYRMVPDALFRAARAAILRGLLERPAIYHTSRARALYETSARANIAAELERLELAS